MYIINLKEVVIQSKRLRIVPISSDYATKILTYFTSDITTYMYPEPSKDLDGVHEYIQKSLNELDDGSNLNAIILDKSTGEFLGCCGCHHLDQPDPELGIWIKKPSHGHGYGLEAVTALITWAKDNLTFDHLKYPVDKRNYPSKRIPEANGGQFIREYAETTLAGKELQLIEYWIY